MDHYLYLMIMSGSVIVPIIFSFHKRLNFHKNIIPFFLGLCIMLPVFISWDIWFTESSIWGFNPDYLVGLYFFSLPLEECLFFICIPFCCTFTYHVVWTLSANNSHNSYKYLSLTISLILVITGVLFIEKWYTSITFIGLSIVLLIALTVVNMKIFYKTFLILLIPFTIVNGLLTGSMIQDQVVWYDNSFNLGIRFFTIPIEDIFYAMFMLLLVMIGYQITLNKRKPV